MKIVEIKKVKRTNGSLTINQIKNDIHDEIDIETKPNGQRIISNIRSGEGSEVEALLRNYDLLFSSAAAALGKLGGSRKSDAKTRACRENGKKGGRKPYRGFEVLDEKITDGGWRAQLQRFANFGNTRWQVITTCPDTATPSQVFKTLHEAREAFDNA